MKRFETAACTQTKRWACSIDLNRLWNQLATGNGVTSQIVRRRIPSFLEQHIDDLAVVVDGAPQVSLRSLNPNEDLIDEEDVAVVPVPAPQSTRVQRSELVAPEANLFVGDEDASPGQQIFNIPMGLKLNRW